MKIFNIGVYGKSETDFFSLLLKNKIDLFIDVRQRRGVRGSKYSFVNSKKLQEKLSFFGIRYLHIIDLAPTNEIRNLQKNADKLSSELKRNRENLNDSFILKYSELILDNYDIKSLIDDFKQKKHQRIVFFCVEEKAKACHRSIITDKLKEEFKFESKNL